MKQARDIYKTPAARRDFVDIVSYIAHHSPNSAERFLCNAEMNLHQILRMPGIGALRSFRYRGLLGIRSLPITGFRNFLLFYRPTRRGITLIRVLHGARDLPRAWRDR